MTELQKMMEFMLGTPLQALLSIVLIVGVGYYFWKVAPKRFEEFQKLNKDRHEESKVVAQMGNQYEKLVENCTRVIENNTMTLKNTQNVLELVVEKAQTNNEEIKELNGSIKDLSDQTLDMHIAITEINAKLNK